MEVFTAYPTLFIGILAMNGIHEQLRCIAYVIRNDVIPFAG